MERTSKDAVVNILDEYSPLIEAKFSVQISTDYGTKKYTHYFLVGSKEIDYHYKLIRVDTASKVELYPVIVHFFSLNGKKKYVCTDERMYLELLETLLESNATKDILKRIESHSLL